MSTEGTRGIKKTLYTTKLEPKDYNNKVLFELTSEKDSFTVYIEKGEALKEGTINKDISVDKVQWLIIKEALWDIYKYICTIESFTVLE